MKAYIFDLDGTLFDSLGVWDQIDIDFLAKRGIVLPADYLDCIRPYSFQETAEYTIERFGLKDSVEQLIQEWNEMAVYAYGNTVMLKPYAREYLLKLKEQKAKLGVATGLPPYLYEPALEHHRLKEIFDVVCSTDEIGCGKSQPDIFLYTAEKLKVHPADCIVFDDIPEAVASAKTAGMEVYGVYDKVKSSYLNELKAIADGVFTDFKNAPLPNEG